MLMYIIMTLNALTLYQSIPTSTPYIPDLLCHPITKTRSVCTNLRFCQNICSWTGEGIGTGFETINSSRKIGTTYSLHRSHKDSALALVSTDRPVTVLGRQKLGGLLDESSEVSPLVHRD